MKKNHKGIFFLSFSGLVAALLLTGCPDPNKNGDSPAVAGPTKQGIAFSGNTLEITFDKELKSFDASQITITLDDNAITEGKTNDYTLSIDDTKLVMTFKTNPIANQKYKVSLKAGAITGKDGGTTKKEDSAEITFGVTPPPAYTGIMRNNNKIELSFNKDLATEASVSPNPTHITVTRAGTSDPLTIGTDYNLSIAGKKLVITLIKSPIAGNYTVVLAKGAVKSADGKFSEAVKPDPTIEMYNLPAIMGAPVFETSNTKLVATFNTGLASIVAGSFTVQSKANEGESDNTYANVSDVTATPDKTDKTKVIITLPDPATEPKMYRVVVAIGGVTAIAGGVSNIAKLESAGVVYPIKPALVGTPYIVGKKLVATFNMDIALLDEDKVEVYKGSGAGTKVTGTTAVVDTTDKTLLEVSLPNSDTSAAGNVYRLKLLADAVSKDGDDKNKNAPATSSDITILAAPVLDTTQDPYMVGDKIYVTFDKAIEYVDSKKVKFKTAGTSGGLGVAIATKPTKGSIVNPTNKKQLVITVDDSIPNTGDYYRVHLEVGAITNRNTALTVAITPTDKDIQVTARPTLAANTQPVFSSKTELSVSFKAAVAFVDTNAIKVQSSTDGTTFTDVSTANRTIAIDGDNSNKVNITLTNNTEATPYTQTWKVIFPVGSVRDPQNNRNNTEQTTAAGTLGLAAVYSWKEVLANGAPKNGDRWSARNDHTSVVFPATGSGSRIWIMGGYDGRNRLNDVWSSADGKNWTNESKKLLDSKAYKDLPPEEKATKFWPARSGHTSVVFPASGSDSRIWVMGGDGGGDYLNDVWSSTDGITWAKSPAPTTDTSKLWSARDTHASVVFGSKIWVMGGYNEDEDDLNDVWSSADGSTWVKAKKTPGKRWSVRDGHEAVVANGKIWVMGGFDNDYSETVWYSTDGEDWTQARDIPVTITGASSALFKSRIWLLGGLGAGYNYRNRVFSLEEGADNSTAWVTEEEADWLARYQHTSVVFGDKIWVLGGKTDSSTYVNEVWSFGVQN